MFAALLAFLGFNQNDMILSRDDLGMVLEYQHRLARRRDPADIESAVEHAETMAFYTNRPGRYSITVDRRKKNIPVLFDRRRKE